jgi:predicted transcriptional regulator
MKVVHLSAYFAKDVSNRVFFDCTYAHFIADFFVYSTQFMADFWRKDTRFFDFRLCYEEFYSQTHLIFELQASMNAEESDKTTIKTENQNEENRRQIVDFIADNGISDSKTVSKAIGLKPSRTRDYLKQLVDEGVLEVEGEYKSRKYRIKK